MPHCLNNKGQGIVPNLKTIVAVSPHLTAEHISQLPKDLAKWTVELRRGCAVTGSASDREIPLYIARANCSNDEILPFNSAQVDYTHLYAKTVILDGAKSRYHQNSDSLRESVKQLLNTRLSMSETIAFDILGKNLRSVPYHDKLALIVPKEVLKNHWQRDLVVVSVKRIFWRISLPESCVLLTDCYTWFPNLTSIDLEIENFISNWDSLELFKGTLRELTVGIYFTNSSTLAGLVRVISRMKCLQILAISSTHIREEDDVSLDPLQLPVNFFASLAASPRLRSIYLGHLYPLRAEEVIDYLKEEVLHQGEMVARQEVLSDITLVGYNHPVYEALYSSRDLSQRMKDRIYCDKDIDHLSATMVLIQRRESNLNPHRMKLLFERLTRFINEDTQILPIVLSLTLHQITRSFRPLGQLLVLLNRLFRTKNLAQQYGPANLSGAVAALAIFFGRRYTTFLGEEYNRVTCRSELECMRLFRLLDHLVEVPTNIPTYLEMLVNITIFHRECCGLPTLFVKQAKKLSRTEQEDFVSEHQNLLISIAENFIDDGRNSRYQFPNPSELDEMFSLILRRTSSHRLQWAARRLLTINASLAAEPGEIAMLPDNVESFEYCPCLHYIAQRHLNIRLVF